jgi:6-pyruvoyltetrahydropterin/6-carboxytetrahydropterin synthase
VDDRGFVVDYADIAAAMKPLLEQLDHHDIDNIIQPSTCERLAEWIYQRLWNHDWHYRKPDGVVWIADPTIRVLVQETPTSGAEYPA